MPTSLPRLSNHVLVASALLAAFVSSFICLVPHPAWASELRQTPVVRAVQAARPSVVNIHGHKTVDSPTEDGRYEGPRRVNGMGTGVVIDQRGYIITNHHVIEGVAQIQVTLHDHRTYTAMLIARDPQTDLAVIRIETSKPLPLMKIGKSDDLMPGETVVAVGNAYGYHHTVTTGIISALDRTVEVTDSQKYYDLIQTDASINPGNSGGPLLNIDGEMIGINVAVRVGAQGIGFAIPVDKAMEIAAKLMQVEQTSKTWHGMSGRSIEHDDVRAFLVSHVEEGSPAAAAGIRTGDIIRQIGSTKIERTLDVERALLDKRPGSSVALRIDRNAKASHTELVLAALPRDRRIELFDDGTVATSVPQPTISRASTYTRVEADAWRMLGVRVNPISASELAAVDTRYNGGLRITAIRTGGAASRSDIRVGDVLVGMHIWETVSLDNLDYVLNRAELEDPQSVKFYVVRGESTRIGEMPLLRR